MDEGEWEDFVDGMGRNRIFEWGHQMCHNAPHDFDFVTTATLTERDLWCLGLALSLVAQEFPCLSGHSVDLQKRLAEVMNAQEAIERGREAWFGSEEEDELPEGP